MSSGKSSSTSRPRCASEETYLRDRLITPMFADSHPRVRYAACQCVYGSLFALACPAYFSSEASYARILRCVLLQRLVCRWFIVS
jgi:hypothetical protein